jgi:hypothetical protein
LGWGWTKRLLLGIDEEESGLWALARQAALGLGPDDVCPVWAWARWAALGLVLNPPRLP